MNANPPARIIPISLLAAAAAACAAPPDRPTAAPRELGRVSWRRGFDGAAKTAADEKRLLLVLFQEVPGCHTCVSYGDLVLSHPLLVEAAETLFLPVAVYNNIKGDDERTLKSFSEPAWNNPVVRILSPDRKSLSIRLADDYSVAGLATAMITALKKSGQTVPDYVRLVAEESVGRQRGLEKATFAMHCFWEGEGALGDLAGVISTKPGFVGGVEVVEVEFDPKRLAFEDLVREAGNQRCASQVFTRTGDQQVQAARIVGKKAVRTDESIRPDREPKYYLLQSPYKHVPMTSLQASRVNSAIGRKTDPSSTLSPRQLAMLDAVRRHPQAPWPLAIGAPDLGGAWDKAQSVLRTAERKK